MEISHKMFRIRRSLPKIRSDPARLPRPLQGLAMTSATFSTSKRKNEMYRPASRTVHFVEKKERERKKRRDGGAKIFLMTMMKIMESLQAMMTLWKKNHQMMI